MGAGKLDCVLQEDLAGSAFPLRVSRWEVLSDIPLRQGAVDRICNRMHTDIGIRVPLELCRMRDVDAAQGDMVARFEGMNVEVVSENGVPIAAEKTAKVGFEKSKTESGS